MASSVNVKKNLNRFNLQTAGVRAEIWDRQQKPRREAVLIALSS